MEISTVIATGVAALFVFELWALSTGKLQREARKSAFSSLGVLVLSLAVLVALGDKVLGGAGYRFVFYGVLLLFNAALFGTLFLRAVIDSRKAH